MAVFDFESICVKNKNFRETKATTWTGRHIPISVWLSSDFIQESIFLCASNPRDLVLSFGNALENWTKQSKAQTKKNSLHIETAIKNRIARILETPNQGRSHCVGNEAEYGTSENSSTQFPQIQKKQQLIVGDQQKSSRDRIISTINFTRSSLPCLKLNIQKQSL